MGLKKEERDMNIWFSFLARGPTGLRKRAEEKEEERKREREKEGETHTGVCTQIEVVSRMERVKNGEIRLLPYMRCVFDVFDLCRRTYKEVQ